MDREDLWSRGRGRQPPPESCSLERGAGAAKREKRVARNQGFENRNGVFRIPGA
jgi:hypothetical protein